MLLRLQDGGVDITKSSLICVNRSMETNITVENKFLLPGDEIDGIKANKGVTLLGPGLRQPVKITTDSDGKKVSGRRLVATQAGTLRHKRENVYWIEKARAQRRYIPHRGDLVVGIVTKRAGDQLKVDIGASEAASLSMFAFEGATKKNRPELQVGDAIYARLISAHREMEPELVCIDQYYKAGILGPLDHHDNTHITSISFALVERLLCCGGGQPPPPALLAALGRHFPYELALGMNGRVWVRARTAGNVLTVCRALRAADGQSDGEIRSLCAKYIR